jgi:glycosyltransferase involved in cell wall biosynthesis
MSRIALISSEPIRPLMAGIGIRYLELARRLAGHGLPIVLLSPAAPEDSAGLPLEGVELRRIEPARLREQLAGCAAAVAQGQLANDLVLAAPDLPAALDLYDPWLIENLGYLSTLGLDPYRNDHATWLLQMSRGDFFLCSSEEQRAFYLGFLAAVGRVNPEIVARDPDLRTLIDVVPFGVADELPPHRPYLPPRLTAPRAAVATSASPSASAAPAVPPAPPVRAAPAAGVGERRRLFGGLYDWYDPWTLLEALALLDRPDWVLLLIRNPNPGTPQRLFAEVEERCRRLGWWGSRVQPLDWVPVERRFDLLRDVDVLVAPHRPTLETRLSLRTRFLDALAAGCPVVTSDGGAMSRMLREHGAGWVVPPGDAAALARALREVLDPAHPPGELAASWRGGAAALLAGFRWDLALAPLLRFCREPRRDAAKERFVHSLATAAPRDAAVFRLRRRLRRLLARPGASPS